MKKTLRRGTAATFLALAIAGCNEQQAAPGGKAQVSPAEVGVVTMMAGSVPRSTELPGRVVALATAEIRPQVDGIIRKRVFEEGAQVTEGDALFELNANKFRAAYNAAAAALKKAEASVPSAQAKFDRARRLAVSKTVSAQLVEEAQATLLQAQADVELAKADVETAQISLDNATIRAPIAGLISKATVSVGALVTANQTDALATIRQVNPIYVDLVDSSANLLRIRDQVQAGTLGRDSPGPPKVLLTLENGKIYDEEGSLSLADIVVTESTGTFSLRAKFSNPNRVLMPGMFVRASVDLGRTPNAFLVPQRAVARTDAGEATAFFVTKDDKVERRVLTAGRAVGHNWLVMDGVSTGDRLIVDGLQKISVGSAVKPIETTIDSDGVVKQKIHTAGQKAASTIQEPAK